MIILSDKYTLKWDRYSWQLDIKVPSKHPKNVTGFKVESRWFPNLTQMFQFIFEDQIKDCEGNTLEDLKISIENSVALIEEMTYEL